METIRVRSEFHTAHRQRLHAGKCQFPHGHTWRGEFILRCERFPRDEMDMSIDFGALKRIMKDYDHKIIVTADDPDFLDAERWDPAGIVLIDGRGPSVENVAADCLEKVIKVIAGKYPDRQVSYDLTIIIAETENNVFEINQTVVI